MSHETTTNDKVWKSPELAERFLKGVRGSIPLAGAQLDIMTRVVRAAVPESGPRVLDLGCGDGILGLALLQVYPGAECVFADFSAPMLAACRERCEAIANGPHKLHFTQVDYGTPDWVKTLAAFVPFDAVVSGFSIHHQPDARKRAVYKEIFVLLRPGGVFVNVEHVSPATKWVEELNSEWFVDALFEAERLSGGSRSREEIDATYYHREDKAANILAPIEDQCAWLRAIGYQDVDIYFKAFELAVFGGRKRPE